MQQTILALCAILVFSIFALSRHRADAAVERTAITGEYELAATDLAKERIETVTYFAFDESDVNGTGIRTSVLGLSTPGTDLGETSGDETTYDDIDDFHGAPARSVSRLWNGQQLQFTDSVAVRYVNPGAADLDAVLPLGARTLAKEVTVTVRASRVGFVGTPPVVAELRQMVTPATQSAFSR